MKYNNICIMRMPEKEESEQGIENLFEQIFTEPWLEWLSELSAGLQTKGLPVQFPVGVHAWVAGQVPTAVCVRGNHTFMFLSLSLSLPSPL